MDKAVRCEKSRLELHKYAAVAQPAAVVCLARRFWPRWKRGEADSVAAPAPLTLNLAPENCWFRVLMPEGFRFQDSARQSDSGITDRLVTSDRTACV